MFFFLIPSAQAEPAQKKSKATPKPNGDAKPDALKQPAASMTKDAVMKKPSAAPKQSTSSARVDLPEAPLRRMNAFNSEGDDMLDELEKFNTSSMASTP